jgi:hypothetical protein
MKYIDINRMIVLGEQTLGEELFSASQLDIKQQRIIKV